MGLLTELIKESLEGKLSDQIRSSLEADGKPLEITSSGSYLIQRLDNLPNQAKLHIHYMNWIQQLENSVRNSMTMIYIGRISQLSAKRIKTSRRLTKHCETFVNLNKPLGQ